MANKRPNNKGSREPLSYSNSSTGPGDSMKSKLTVARNLYKQGMTKGVTRLATDNEQPVS